ncbi:GspE/PulE family protein [Patescibacteria group bacterium]|nr:GspE/PulE family protein [Patescibacteria group bacterium]
MVLSSQTSRDKNIDDLIKMTQRSQGSLQISTEETEEKLQNKMIEIDEKNKEDATRNQAEKNGYNYIFLKGFPVTPEALSLISEKDARSLRAVCFFRTDNEFRIGAINPSDPAISKAKGSIAKDLNANGDLYQISDKSLEEVFKLYAVLPKVKKHEGGIEITEEEIKNYQRELKTFRDLAEKIQHVSMSDLLTIVLASAIQSRASDVHIEAEENDIKIRFRVDGYLHDVAVIQKRYWEKIVNRIKLIAKLKINIVDVPQDGRYTIYLSGEMIDVRVSTVPSAFGESIVMRLLMSTATAFDLDDLGLTGESYKILAKQIRRPNGMILNTGPTGSGKTTTLYAILKQLNKPETKIITLENPIEYRLKGIIQSQVETSELAEEGKESEILTGQSGRKSHYTYAIGLRSVLRQDPDIVMIGEIRDQQTAEISIQAALTGHLMLSTLHTNRAAGAIPRLLSMGAKPFLLAPSLNLIIAQRLVRRVCNDCKQEFTPEPADMTRIKQAVENLPEYRKKEVDPNAMKFFKGQGCEKCSSIGYKGRIGIFEFITMNQDIQKLILSGQIAESQIQEAAQKDGMVTMVQDGILKSLQGLTTYEEVFRVID